MNENDRIVKYQTWYKMSSRIINDTHWNYSRISLNTTWRGIAIKTEEGAYSSYSDGKGPLLLTKMIVRVRSCKGGVVYVRQ